MASSTDFNLTTVGISTLGEANFEFGGATISGAVFETESYFIVSRVSSSILYIKQPIFEVESVFIVSNVKVSGWKNSILGISYLNISTICGVGINDIKEEAFLL